MKARIDSRMVHPLSKPGGVNNESMVLAPAGKGSGFRFEFKYTEDWIKMRVRMDLVSGVRCGRLIRVRIHAMAREHRTNPALSLNHRPPNPFIFPPPNTLMIEHFAKSFHLSSKPTTTKSFHLSPPNPLPPCPTNTHRGYSLDTP